MSFSTQDALITLENQVALLKAKLIKEAEEEELARIRAAEKAEQAERERQRVRRELAEANAQAEAEAEAKRRVEKDKAEKQRTADDAALALALDQDERRNKTAEAWRSAMMTMSKKKPPVGGVETVGGGGGGGGGSTGVVNKRAEGKRCAPCISRNIACVFVDTSARAKVTSCESCRVKKTRCHWDKEEQEQGEGGRGRKRKLHSGEGNQEDEGAKRIRTEQEVSTQLHGISSKASVDQLLSAVLENVVAIRTLLEDIAPALKAQRNNNAT